MITFALLISSAYRFFLMLETLLLPQMLKLLYERNLTFTGVKGLALVEPGFHSPPGAEVQVFDAQDITLDRYPMPSARLYSATSFSEPLSLVFPL